MLEYPSKEDIIQLNKEVLETISVMKADRHRTLSEGGIETAIRATKDARGDVYDKATILVIKLVKGHYFDSGNRRTAFEACRVFLKLNGESPIQSKNVEYVLLGIREGFYAKNEVKEWLKGHGIKPFER